MFLLEYARCLTYAPTIPLIWAMFADVVDYSEWKTGRRITGVIYATILFGLKTGLSLGGAMAGWLLSGFGYQANAVQTPQCAAGDSHDHQRVSRLLFRHRNCLPGVLQDRQEVEHTDPG